MGRLKLHAIRQSLTAVFAVAALGLGATGAYAQGNATPANPTPAVSPTAAPKASATPAPAPQPAGAPSSSPAPAATPDAVGRKKDDPSDPEALKRNGATMGMGNKAGLGPSGKTPAGAPVARPATNYGQPTVPEEPASAAGQPLGLDVSGYQGNVDWNYVASKGARFAFIKASEGTWSSNSYFAQQYNGAASVGLIRGAYHFARPNLASGAAQAQAFVANGGGWSADGITLPGVLDIEDHPAFYNSNPYYENLDRCYSMSPAQLGAWVADFLQTYYLQTNKQAVIYTNYSFWNQCLGGSTRFASTNPLWASAWWASSPWMYGGWGMYTFWQYADQYADQAYTTMATFPGDQDVFNGSLDQLRVLASTPDYYPIGLIPGAQLVTGKWGGNGRSLVGWFKDGFWCLEMPARPRYCFNFGMSGDIPVVGDWSGTGTAGIGVFRNGQWWLVDDITTMAITHVVNFGWTGDTPIVGKWNGGARDSIGIWRNSSFQVAYDFNNPVVNAYTNFGTPTDTPIVGDWTGSGKTGIGVWRQGAWWLSDTVGPNVSRLVGYGIGTDRPITGDWDGNGTTTFGIVRGNLWELSNSPTGQTVDVVKN